MNDLSCDYKIVINSFKPWDITRTECLKSLISIGFKKFNNVILVLGGAEIEKPPRLIRISDVTNTTEKQLECITVIEITDNHIDFNGLVN